jgi:hypothetical protein
MILSSTLKAGKFRFPINRLIYRGFYLIQFPIEADVFDTLVNVIIFDIFLGAIDNIGNLVALEEFEILYFRV